MKLPELYAMICEGSCMEPEFANGDVLLFNKDEPFSSGDLVALYLRPELVRPGQCQAAVKRLVLAPPADVKFPLMITPRVKSC